MEEKKYWYHDPIGGEWKEVVGPSFPSNVEVRESAEKPRKLVEVNGVSFAMPSPEGFKDGETYYMPNLLVPSKPIRGMWPYVLHAEDTNWMFFIHKDKNDAVKHALAIQAYSMSKTPVTVDGSAILETALKGRLEK